MKTVKLSTMRETMKVRCTRILSDAMEAEPDAVFVVYRKDGLTHFQGAFYNRLEMIGACEAAKQEIWSAE